MASFSVINNIASANAQANLATTNIGLQKALNRLSSGLRINSSGDDASGGFSIFVSNDSTNGIIGGTVGAADVAGLSLTGKAVSSDTLAQAALTAITSAISSLGTVQGQVGTIENRLSYAISLAQSQI